MAPPSSFVLHVPVIPDEVRFGVCGSLVLGVGHVLIFLTPTVVFSRWGVVALGAFLLALGLAFLFTGLRLLPGPLRILFSGSTLVVVGCFPLRSLWGCPLIQTLLATFFRDSSSSLYP